MKKLKKTDEHITKLINELLRKSYELKAPIWKDVARRLSKSRKNYAVVNIGKLSRYAVENGIYIIPGTLLGSGFVAKKIKVAAFRISKSAKMKIEDAGGRVVSISELLAEHPDGSNIQIIG
jgi:large subunit ribosomal protein L18e